MQQFTFICAVAEVNVCYSQARGRDEAPVPQLNFRQKLTQQLLLNTLDALVVVPVARVANRRCSNTVHALRKRGKNEGKWQPAQCHFRKIQTVYQFYNANAAKPRCAGRTAHAALQLLYVQVASPSTIMRWNNRF